MLFFQKEDVTDPIEILTYGKGWAEIDYEVHFGLDIYDISPKMGSIVGGTEITISGSGFLPFEFEEEDKNWVIHSEYNIYFGYDPIFHLNVPDSPKRPDPWTSGWNRGYKCEVTEITNYQVKCVMPRVGPCEERVLGGWAPCAQGSEMSCLCPKDESKLYSGIGYPAMFTNDHVGEIQLMDLEIIWNYQYPIIGRCAADEGNSSCTFEYSELATPQFSPFPETRVQNMVGGGSLRSSSWEYSPPMWSRRARGTAASTCRTPSPPRTRASTGRQWAESRGVPISSLTRMHESHPHTSCHTCRVSH